MVRGRGVSVLTAAAAVACSVGLVFAQADAGARADELPPVLTPVKTVGGPGHAALYGWGAATMLDGTILIGDYWNYRVLRFNADGTPVGDGVFIDNRGFGPTQHQAPYGMGIDPRNGDVYLADTDRDTIDVYDKDGQFLRTWGAPGSGPGRFLYASRVVIDSQGTVYVADTWANQIVVFNDQGQELRRIGSFGSAPGQMKQPHGLALDADDNLYVTDTNNFRIQAFRPGESTPYLTFGCKGTAPGCFRGDMRGLTVDKANGWIYAVDAAGNRISKFDLAGNYLLRWGSEGDGPGQFHDGGREITVDADSNVWVGDMPSFRAQKFSPDGEYLLSVHGAKASDPQGPPANGFNGPRGVAVGPDGSVYVSDTYNWRISRFDAEGQPVQQWGRRGRAEYEFNYTRLLATDPSDGDVVIADTDNQRIKAYTFDGQFKWQVGEYGAGPGQFKNPHGVEVGPDGRVYVADSRNTRVQILTPDGAVERVFGTNGTGPGQLKFPRGITVDPTNGEIYVVDSGRDLVLVYDNQGTYLRTIGQKGLADNQLNNPFDIAVDDKFAYVSDPAAHKIKVLDKVSGQSVGVFGSRGKGLGQFMQPDGLHLTPDGMLYVAEEGNERVQVLQVQR